jgi:hypothetical protein
MWYKWLNLEIKFHKTSADLFIFKSGAYEAGTYSHSRILVENVCICLGA